MNIEKLNKLNNLVSLFFRRKHTTILNPKDKEKEDSTSLNTEYDAVEWEIEDEDIRIFVKQLFQNNQLSDEDKILSIYEKICQKYIYDDNLISYIQKQDDDSFSVPDGYGRATNQEWKKNREQHNRRVCYELARNLAESLTELFQNNEDFNICIFYDKGLTHYFVGLTCSEYSITLDPDDFSNIKDLTRIKAGLTAQGIKILQDKENKFTNALNKFNEGKSNDSINKIETEIDNVQSTLKTYSDNQITEPEDIIFLRNAIQILKEKYDIDSQGLFEYMKEIVDIKLGPEARKKVWKILKENDNRTTRCVRCLLVNVDGQDYIIDVDKMILRQFDKEELERDDTNFAAYEKIAPRNWKVDGYKGE